MQFSGDHIYIFQSAFQRSFPSHRAVSKIFAKAIEIENYLKSAFEVRLGKKVVPKIVNEKVYKTSVDLSINLLPVRK